MIALHVHSSMRLANLREVAPDGKLELSPSAFTLIAAVAIGIKLGVVDVLAVSSG